jgi:hypothetical protein
MRRTFKFLRTATTLARDNILIWPSPRQDVPPPPRPRTDG